MNENTKDNTLLIGIYDNGCGMSEEQVKNVIDPFYTTRTTRKVGMGIPLFKMSCEQTGGKFTIESEKGVGTKINALYKTDSIDFTPLGDIASTIVTIVSMNNDKEFLFRRILDDKEFVFSTEEIKKILGGVPLSEPSVMTWVEEYLNEQYNELLKG